MHRRADRGRLGPRNAQSHRGAIWVWPTVAGVAAFALGMSIRVARDIGRLEERDLEAFA